MSYSNSTETNVYPSYGITVFLTSIFVWLVVISLTGNFLLCTIVYRRAAMRSGINLLLTNLASCDFLTSLIVIPGSLLVLNFKKWCLDEVVCDLSAAIYTLLHLEKVLMLLILTINRHLIIIKGKDSMTQSKSLMFILFSWIISLLISLLPLLGWRRYTFKPGFVQCFSDFNNRVSASYVMFFSLTQIFLPSIVLVLLYSQMLRTVKRKFSRVQHHVPTPQTSAFKNLKRIIDFNFKIRTTLTLFLISVTYVVTEIPLGIMNIILSLDGLTTPHCITIYSYFVWLSFTHSVIYPIFYYFQMTKFKESVKQLTPSFCGCDSLIWNSRKKWRVFPENLYVIKNRTNVCT